MFRRSSRLMKGRLANAALRVVGSGISWAARAIVLVVRVPLTRRSRSSSVSQVLAIVAPCALFNLLSMIASPPSSRELRDWGSDYDQSFQERVIARRASA